jgi:WD40 repeat protein
LKTHVILKEDGSIKSQWLLSSSDDATIRIWDIVTQNCLEELIGHKNGVTVLSCINNRLFSGSFDHYVIVWDLEEIQSRIRET